MSTKWLLSDPKTALQKVDSLTNHYWFLELVLNNLGLGIVSIFAIIPALYFGVPSWLKVVYIWAPLTVIAFSLVKLTLSLVTKKYLIIKEKQPTKASIGFVLQRFVAVTITVVVMISSGIIGTRCFGKNLAAQSCLVCQISRENYSAALWLIVVGADLNKTDEFGQTPLIHAVNRKQGWLAKLLVFSGADVEVKDKAVLSSPLIVAVHQGNFELAELLLKNKANPNRLVTNVSPLRIALNKNRFDIAKLLLEYGADPNMRDPMGMTPLLYESKWGTVNTVGFLVNNKANVNVVNNNNESPLYLAVASGKKEIVVSLLASGAKVDGNGSPEIRKETTNDETPLMAATRLNNTEIAKLLVEKGAK